MTKISAALAVALWGTLCWYFFTTWRRTTCPWCNSNLTEVRYWQPKWTNAKEYICRSCGYTFYDRYPYKKKDVQS